MALKRKTRMYEPWGYQEENDYVSNKTQIEIELEKLFASANYNEDDKKIHFYNLDGEELKDYALDTTKFAGGGGGSVIESATYDKETNILTIVFTNGDVVEINLADLIDENEFADGLIVEDGLVKVLIDQSSDQYLTVSENGIKLSGVEDEINDINTSVTNIEGDIVNINSAITEISSALTSDYYTKEEIDEKEDAINQRISENSAAISEEAERAISAETSLANSINTINESIDELFAIKFDDVTYDASGKTINFIAENEIVKQLDATPFIKDGIIDEVYVDHDTNELVIVWNTEAGKQETRIPLSDIFNPDDYYTKDEIDEIVSGITASEEDLEYKIAQLRQALNEEIDRATTKEEELEGTDIVSGNVASDATISVTKNNGNVITFASAEKIDLEAGEF